MGKKESFKDKVHNSKKGYKAFAVGAAIGVVVGAIVGLLKAPKKGEDLQADLKVKFKGVSEKLDSMKEQYEPKLKSIFGNLGQETHDVYLDFKDELVLKCEDFSGKLEQKDYDSIVDDVVSSLKESKTHLAPKIEQLGTEFKESWEELKDLFEAPVKPTETK